MTLCIILAALILVASVLAATLGAADIGFFNAGKIMLSRLPLFNHWLDLSALPPMHQKIVIDLRLPRILLSLLVGALLSGSGAVYQSVFRNPMADPFVLGISSGAALGAALVMIFGWNIGLAGMSSVSVAAFICALLTTAVVYKISSVSGRTPVLTLVLTGIAMSFFLSSTLSLFMTFNRDRLEQIVFWTYGTLSTANWYQVTIALPFFLVSSGYFISKGRVLNLMTLGEDSAKSLGVDVEKERQKLLVIASLATATAVSVSGIIGFVGLIIPHMIRLISGPDNRSLIPLSILSGSLFLLLSDTLARTLVVPMEIPLGIITSFVGAPYFIFLILKHKKRGF